MFEVYKRTLARSLKPVHVIIAAAIGLGCGVLLPNICQYYSVPAFNVIVNETSLVQHAVIFAGINGVWLITYIANISSGLIADETHEGTLRMLLAKPNSRGSVLAGKLLASLTATMLLIITSLSVYALALALSIHDSNFLAALLKYIPSYILYGAIVTLFFNSVGLLLSCVLKRSLFAQLLIMALMIIIILAFPLGRIINEFTSSGLYSNPLIYLIDINYHFGTMYRFCIERCGEIKGTSEYLTLFSYFTNMFSSVSADTDITLTEAWQSTNLIKTDALPVSFILAGYAVLTAFNYLMSFRLFKKKNV